MHRGLEMLFRGRYLEPATVTKALSPANARLHWDHFRWLRQVSADPDIARVVPYALFDCMVDSMLRSNHGRLNGGIAPIAWTGWNRYAPPLGSGCRCSLIALTAARAKSLLATGTLYFDLTSSQLDGAGPDAAWERRDGWWEQLLEFCRGGGVGLTPPDGPLAPRS